MHSHQGEGIIIRIILTPYGRVLSLNLRLLGNVRSLPRNKINFGRSLTRDTIPFIVPSNPSPNKGLNSWIFLMNRQPTEIFFRRRFAFLRE